ncbi:Streptomyces sporulation and cell division protein, SsgA [Klenkia marina]|uniref:Streptomyces sporulation and cell division protein, SsgA n=1 Tax=Klenkia marina TaxID=1960309 RepID=A0A1G4YB12_9ACTN|nr:Streptomyces sporulation and cell division protein, SsgA [Klenkia marina]
MLQLVGPTAWTRVTATLTYDPRDPFAVRVRFGGRSSDGTDDDGVEWLVARDLLHAGLTRPSGEGDVRLWPARTAADVLFLELRAPSGHALFELSRAVLAGFLATTEQLVPLGGESDAADMDPELLALLQDE